MQDKIRDYFKKWSPIVERYGWQFDVLYYENAKDLGHKDYKKHRDSAMFVKSDFQYLKAQICVVLENCDMEDRELETAVVHELIHIMLAPYLYGLHEYVTETIAREFLRLDA